MKPTQFLNAREAAAELAIRPATLYAYVSRGLLRSEAAGAGQRARRYRAEDVQRLKDRQEQRRDPGRRAQHALHWGDPVLESGITLIAEGRVYYRGRDALALAEQHTAEQVAALIWLGSLDARVPGLEGALPPVALRLPAPALLSGLSPAESFQVALPLAAANDPAAYDLRPAAVAATGARILRLLAGLAAGRPARAGLAQALAEAWAPRDSHAARLINAALILCADHELNVSSFTARCVASAGATPYAVVAAGLAALGGAKHGGHGERVEAFLREAGSPGGARRAMVARLKRGEAVPGFGHPLYPQGDPRGAELLRLAREAYPRSAAVALAGAAARHAEELVGERPNLDFGLVVLSRAMKLPEGGALAIFALGRAIGWIGHAIEQYPLDKIIRPRARYTGELPGEGVV